MWVVKSGITPTLKKKENKSERVGLKRREMMMGVDRGWDKGCQPKFPNGEITNVLAENYFLLCLLDTCMRFALNTFSIWQLFAA